MNDNHTLNIRLGQDSNRSLQSLSCVNTTLGREISHVGVGDTSFHFGHALGGVDSRLPSMSSGAYGLVDSSAHGLVLRVARDVLQDAYGVSHANVNIHANVDSHDTTIKDSYVSFKVISSGPLSSDQGLSFWLPKITVST
ncbi:hypothetical protein PanWU01x14_283260 [Parasponia andersonii]|uniref:Uncharacterized protein n=1 Tax=Parasponia andersonii TaxID=3476 RepID=A0A2P5B0H1_PARAD|nr:hypothetical protein PanWU01x14_283260 [Parasponia andersonii]